MEGFDTACTSFRANVNQRKLQKRGGGEGRGQYVANYDYDAYLYVVNETSKLQLSKAARSPSVDH